MLKNRKLSQKLGIGFGLLIIMIIAIAAVSIYNLGQIQARLTTISDDNVAKLINAYEMNLRVDAVRREVRNLIIDTDMATMQGDNDRLQKAWKELDAMMAELDKVINTDKGRQLYNDLKTAIEAAKPIDNEVAALGLANKAEEARAILVSSASPANAKMTEAILAMVEFRQQQVADNVAMAKSSYGTTMILVISLSVFAIAFGVVMAIFLTRSITKPINGISGNLNEGSMQVTAASEQLSDASQRLAEANSEQASALEETSSTLEESSSMIQQNTENTKQAALLAGQTKNFADKGNSEMVEMSTAMAEIKKSSDQIAKIIKVIDEIAFQTNILALNAAVEAARAGEAGMGFAVVAEEVRNLAQRSAQAAKDTEEIIERNISLSNRGVEVTKRVGESLAEITIQAKKVNELMDEIAAASQEQAQGILQVNKAISQMEKVTQENAATAEESAASSEELSSQSMALQDIVRQLLMLVNGQDAEGERYSQASRPGGKSMGKNHGSSDRHLKSPAKPKLISKTSSYSEDKGKTRVIDPEDIIPLDDDTNDF